jgi:thiol-disulfide isomerase/thioredoxin
MLSRFRKKFRKAICVIFASSLLISCPGKVTIEDTTTPKEVNPITWHSCSYLENDHPCDLVLAEASGQPWQLYEHFGSIIVLDFSTEWCGYCQVAGSVIESIADDYADRGVIFVTILIEDMYGEPADVALAEKWKEHFELTGPVLAGDRSLLDAAPLDPEGVEGWPVGGFPNFFFIDRDMRLRAKVGGWSEMGIRYELDRLLSEEAEVE